MRWTPLHYAVMGNHKMIAATLLKYAPSPYVTVNRRDVNSSPYWWLYNILLENRHNAFDARKRGEYWYLS